MPPEAVPALYNGHRAEANGHAPERDLRELKVAIVHFWLVNYRGGEKVIDVLLEMFPQSDIFTHVYDPKRVSKTIREKTVRTTFIQNLPFARKGYQFYLPLMPVALEQLDLSGYDLVISSESGPAKGVIVPPETPHICYCLSPMRYVWDQYHTYRNAAGGLKRFAMYFLMSSLRQWDVTSASRIDRIISISNAVSKRVHRYWRRDSVVVAPPVDVERYAPAARRDDFYLHAGELVAYKRVDLAIAACNALKRRLIVIGTGPEEKRLKAMAGPTIEFLGRLPDDLLAQHYSRCRALLFPAEEDFGMVPIEAMAAGAPVIAFARGGARDYVCDGVTGLFFAEQTPESLIEGIVKFDLTAHTYDSRTISEFAKQNFNKDLFKAKFAAIVNSVLDEYDKKSRRLELRVAAPVDMRESPAREHVIRQSRIGPASPGFGEIADRP